MRPNLGALLGDSAARHPDGDALVLDGARVSYAQLESRANRFAHSLRARGVRPGDRVGLWAPKSHAAFVALWGALKAGAAYVPVDPGAPPARLGTLARDAALAALVISPDRAEPAAAATEGLASLRALWIADAAMAGLPGKKAAAPTTGANVAGGLPRVSAAEVDAAPDAPPGEAPRADDLAYVLYTSGSTGVPKGVVHTHGSALAFVEWAAAEFALTSADRVSSHAPFHFDLSTFDVFAAALAGAAVYPVPPRAAMFPTAIASLYAKERLTVLYETPSGLALLLRHGALAKQDLSALRVLLFAGEVMPVPLLRELMALAPRARFANLYGPTETNVCTWYDVTSAPPEDLPLPIGIPCSGDEVWLLDEELRPVGPDATGELWVSGASVMRGYWGDAERTERTLRAIAPDGVQRRAYRTGDLVRRGPGGALLFHGRRDHQVKTRGYRVELGEIESALHAHPAVSEAVVVPVPDPEIGCRLRALVVLRGAAGEAELKDHCARTLPRYMVPEFIEFRAALPRTSSGKVDRAALTAEPARKDAT